MGVKAQTGNMLINLDFSSNLWYNAKMNNED